MIQFGTEKKQECLVGQVKNRSGKVFEDGVKKSFEDVVCGIGFVWNSQMRMKRSRVTGSRKRVFLLHSPLSQEPNVQQGQDI